MLNVSGVEFSYGAKSLLSDINLTCRPGEIVGIVGPSGCGKSTLAKLTAGVLKPQNGEIHIGGAQVLDAARRQEVGFLQQGAEGLLPFLTVYANTAMPILVRKGKLLIRGLDFSDRRRCVRAMRTARIDHASRSRPEHLSGGMRARALIARALAQSPKILIMDESFSGIDEAMCEQLYIDMERFVKKLGLVCLLISHRLSEIVFLCDYVHVFERCPLGDGYTLGDPLQITLPRPRSIEMFGDPEFARFTGLLRSRIVKLGTE